MADARPSLDGRNEEQESQHGAFLDAGLGLERLEPRFPSCCAFYEHCSRNRIDLISLSLSIFSYLTCHIMHGSDGPDRSCLG